MSITEVILSISYINTDFGVTRVNSAIEKTQTLSETKKAKVKGYVFSLIVLNV